MQVREIMSQDLACCTPDTKLSEVAQMMVENDCGSIPVVESQSSFKPVGIITDRDITSRTVAANQNPLKMSAGDIMSSPVVTVGPETTLDDCCQTMEEKQIRRIPVVDGDGGCCGIVAQADIAANAPRQETGELLQEVSQPTKAASKIG